MVLLVLAAIIGIPISAAAYGFLALVDRLQKWIYQDLPHGIGLAAAPRWWAVPVLLVAGAIVGVVIRYLPGRGGHIPAHGLSTAGVAGAVELPGIALAALVGLGLGAVLGPEAPLIALGGGLAALVARRNANQAARSMIGAAGSFAAISTLLGSPLLGAFLLMEASGLGGAMLGLVLVPGLLTAGIGTVVFIGLGQWTGLGSLSLALPPLPKVGQPSIAAFGWSLVIGVAAALLGFGIRWLARGWSDRAGHRIVVAAPVAGLIVGGLAWIWAASTGRDISEMLFSGQNALGNLLSQASSYPVWTLVVLLATKGVAYVLCLGALRGGPIFPAMFLGAAVGIAMSHLPGLPMVSGAAMGIGAMTVAMLRLPLTAVLLATLLFTDNGLDVMPVVIVAVVVSHVLSARLEPPQWSHAESSTSVSSGPGVGEPSAVTGSS